MCIKSFTRFIQNQEKDWSQILESSDKLYGSYRYISTFDLSSPQKIEFFAAHLTASI